MSVRIGVDNLVYAIMTTEEDAETEPVYGTVKTAPGVMSIGVNPNGSIETLFADDGPMESATTLGKIEVEIKKAALNTSNRADFLGHEVDANGGLIYGDNDTSPFIAIGFRTLRSDGTYRFSWLYKGRFAEPEDTNETKGDSISFQADTIKGQFVKLNHAYTIGTRSIRPWKYDMDESDTTANAVVITSWFTAPVFPSNTVTA